MNDLTHTYPSAHQHLSPERAGVGPAQLIGFPHQKTSKDAVEDVSLLKSGEEFNLNQEVQLRKVSLVKTHWGHFKSDSRLPPLPPFLPPPPCVLSPAGGRSLAPSV